MTEVPVVADHETTHETNTPADLGHASLWRVVRDQRKTILVAVVLLNHLATEYWLLRIITSGEEPTRNKLAMSSLVRLLVLSVVAVGIAVWFWPDGIGLLFGLAVFRLIALVMTTMPLLKELKNQ